MDYTPGVKEGKGMQLDQQLRTKLLPYEYLSKGEISIFSRMMAELVKQKSSLFIVYIYIVYTHTHS